MKNLLCYLTLLVFSLQSLSAGIPHKEMAALVELHDATHGTHWTTTWNMTTDVSTWHGVKVVDGHVVEINLFRNNLEGTIPKSISNLKNLISLNLAFNSLTGELPVTIVDLSRLKVLKLVM